MRIQDYLFFILHFSFFIKRSILNSAAKIQHRFHMDFHFQREHLLAPFLAKL